jgi:adenylate kinase
MLMARLLILGRQGSGKGTQCARLAAHYGIPHISTGEILRAAVAEGTELGREAKAIMDAGDLVPDRIMLDIIRERLAQPDAGHGFLLDGFPRTAAQDSGLAEILGDEGLDLAVNLEVPDDVVVERMLARGRADDTEEAIRTRLDLYEAETAPLLERYRREGILATVDGVGSEDEVFDRLVEVIDTHRAVGLSSGST